MPSLESLSSLGFEERNLGCPGNFAGISRTPGGVQKVCTKKSSCASLVPCRCAKNAEFLGSVFGRTDFVWIFIFGPPDRGFCRRIFSAHFRWKKCPEKSSRKIPFKILQILYNKNPPTHFCRLARTRNFKIGHACRNPYFKNTSVSNMFLDFLKAKVHKHALKHPYIVNCSNRLRVGVHAKNASFVGPFYVESTIRSLRRTVLGSSCAPCYQRDLLIFCHFSTNCLLNFCYFLLVVCQYSVILC